MQPPIHLLQVFLADGADDLEEAHAVLDVAVIGFCGVTPGLELLFLGYQDIGDGLDPEVEAGLHDLPGLGGGFQGFLGGLDKPDVCVGGQVRIIKRVWLPYPLPLVVTPCLG